MLYLGGEYHLVKGVSVFPDHANKRQFYFLPLAPHLTVINGKPQIQLLQFTGAAGSGGFLNFTVDLGITPEHFESVRSEIARVFDVDGEVLLSPALLENGETRLSALGRTSGQPTPPPDGTPPPPADFVVKIDHPAKPSLFGNNQATFSLQLDEAGVTLVKESFNGVLMPIGVVFDLEFLALRPAYNVRVHADWDRVQRHFQERAEARLLFLSAEVDTMVDKLIEDQVIVIEVDNFVPEGEDASALITDPKKVLAQVKDMIFTTFFTPTLNPVDGAKDGWDRATDIATKVSTLAVTGGWAGIASASYKKVDLTRVDRKLFDFNLRERTTVRRRIYPQAHLQGLAEILHESGHQPADFIRSVITDGDPFFRRRRVRVINRVDLQGDQVASVKASLRYGNQTKSAVLDAKTPEVALEWSSIVTGGAVLPDVRADYKVSFNGIDTLERPAAITAPARVISDEIFEIEPAADDLYHVVNVPITPLNFPWDRYPLIQVDLRYTDRPNAIALSDTVLLTREDGPKSWKWFLRDRAKDTFEYRVIYRAADNRDVSLDWQTASDEQVLLRDPRPAGRTVTVVPPQDWSLVSQVFVDLLYRDDRNGVRGEASMLFNADQPEPQTFTVAIEDVNKRVVEFDVSMLLSDGTLIEFPHSTTLKNRIVVTPDMRGHRVVTVRPQAIDFVAKKVREVRATLRYRDANNALDYTSDFTFTSRDDVAYFEYDFVDPQRRAYTVGSKTIFTDGFTKTRAPKTVDVDDVSVTVI